MDMKKVREGYKMTELGEIPEEWQIKSIAEIAQLITKGTTPSTIGFGFVEEGINYIRAENINQTGKFEGEFLKISKECNEKLSRSIIIENDILVSIVGFYLGKTAIVTNKEAPANTNQNLALVRIFDSNYYNNYIKKTFESDYLKNYIKKNLTEGAQPSLSLKQIGDFKIPIPNKMEQQKISHILDMVDEEIEIMDNLIEKTKELKKGLMQRLLTKGIGHSRFKDTEIGRIPEKWEIRRFIDISQGKGEYGIGAVATEYIVGNPRYLRITDIGDESRLLFNDIKGLDDEEYEKYLLKYNDVVFARTGNTTGKSYVYNIKDGELVYAGFLIKFSINPKLANVNFIKYLIQSKRYWDWVNVMSTRSGQPGINSAEYAKLLIQLPSLEEQEQIALILTSVDEQIDKYESKKEKLQELKKGLMQKLLTGKIRVQ